MATHGFGITLSGATSGAIAYLLGLEPPGLTRDEIDTTTHSTTDGKETSIPSKILKIDAISGKLIFDKTQETTMRTAMAADPEVWTITNADGDTWVGSGYFTGLIADEVVVDDCMRHSFTLKFTAGVVFSAS